MNSLLLALQFLTRWPVAPRGGSGPAARDWGRSTRWFPAVGLLAGLELLAIRWGLGRPWALGGRPLASAALLLAAWVWTCDSLHLDALADTADGLASRKRGADLLAVMHDSRSGAFGVQAVAVTVVLKAAWLASLPARLGWVLPLPLVASRLLAALLCRARPYAGRSGSLSGAFIEGAQPGDAAAAAALAGAIGAAWCLGAVAWGGARPGDCLRALAVCLAALAAGWAAVRVPRARLGGVSGDLIGFGLEVCEVAAAYGLLFIGPGAGHLAGFGGWG